MQSKSSVQIVKANGEHEFFNPKKLHTSLVRSGADTAVAATITSRITDSLHDGDRTKDIYNRAFSMLRHLERPLAARYSMKRALLELGPSGYPFEDFLAEIYRALGYAAKTRVIAQGKCVPHEMDLVAVRDDERLGAEAKFHNSNAIKSDLKVVLYVQARYEDLAAHAKKESEHDFTTRMLITNTKFTEQAEKYAECAGLSLVSWSYPKKGNLRHLIEDTHLHPVSCLTTLSRAHKRRLMERGFILCRHLREQKQELSTLGLSDKAIESVFDEVQSLCSQKK